MASSQGTPSTILIVDDTPANLGVAVEALESHGFRVLIACDGREGLQRAGLASPDLLLLDVAMPGMDGFEVCRRLKAQPETAEIPVMFMTSFADREHELKGFEVGAVDYVTKPLRVSEVVARVGAHIGLHAMRRQLEAKNAQLQREVDERRQAEHALERQQAFLRQVIDIFPHFLHVRDRAGRFTLVNRAMAERLDTTVEDMLGKTTADYVSHYAELERYQRDDREVTQHKREISIPEEHYTDAAGEGHILQTIKRPLLDERGQVTHVLGVSTDITARRRAEKALQEHQEKLEQLVMQRTSELAESNRRLREEINERKRAEDALREAHDELEARVAERTLELSHANKDLESFTYSVSHDLRAPLRAISGFAQILARHASGRLDEDGRHYLDNIMVAARRMQTLIEDLLQYSRTGRAAVRRVPVPLALVAQRLAATFEARINAIGACFEVVEPLATPLGDPTLVEQVLSNLLDNALIYHCREGRPRIRFTAVRENGEVTLSLTDNGIGIASEYHEKIFQVFQRLHGEEEYPGTGIGLAIVAKAVRLMEGQINVDSAPGRGSRFSVRLPAATAEGAVDEQPRLHTAH